MLRLEKTMSLAVGGAKLPLRGPRLTRAVEASVGAPELPSVEIGVALVRSVHAARTFTNSIHVN